VSDDVRTVTVTPDLQDYVVDHGSWPVDSVLIDLHEQTAALGDVSGMQVGPDQGQLLTFLAGLVGTRQAVEVGTFTGYSSLCIARAMPKDGLLVCCDLNEKWTAIGRKAWKRAGVADRIDLRIGPGLDTVRNLPTDPHLDFVFIDADKVGYVSYWNELVPRVRSGGLVVADNVLWSGRIVDADAEDGDTQALRAFNDLVVGDDRVEVVILPAFDGLLLARRK
jgi:caffeoyl-CoA O-methyltransferase